MFHASKERLTAIQEAAYKALRYSDGIKLTGLEMPEVYVAGSVLHVHFRLVDPTDTDAVAEMRPKRPGRKGICDDAITPEIKAAARAWYFSKARPTQTEVGVKFKVAQGTVSKWVKQWKRENEVAGLDKIKDSDTGPLDRGATDASIAVSDESHATTNPDESNEPRNDDGSGKEQSLSDAQRAV